ncbi:MAG: hypothetical protein AAGE18_14450 [Pseudomonadota bacterium]
MSRETTAGNVPALDELEDRHAPFGVDPGTARLEKRTSKNDNEAAHHLDLPAPSQRNAVHNRAVGGRLMADQISGPIETSRSARKPSVSGRLPVIHAQRSEKYSTLSRAGES